MPVILGFFLVFLNPAAFAVDTIGHWKMTNCKEKQCIRITSPLAKRNEVGRVFYLKGIIKVELREDFESGKPAQIFYGSTGYYEVDMGIITIDLNDGKRSLVYLMKEGRWGFLPTS